MLARKITLFTYFYISEIRNSNRILYKYCKIIGQMKMTTLDEIEAVKKVRRGGNYQDALKILDEIYRKLTYNQVLEKIECLNEQSICIFRIGNHSKAESKAKDALMLAESKNNFLEAQAISLNLIGIANWVQGNLDLAEKALNQSLEIKEGIGDPGELAIIYNNLGLLNFTKGNLKLAEKHYNQSLEIAKSEKDQELTAYCLNNLGELYDQRGELIKAEEFYRNSLEIKNELGVPRDIASSLINLGLVLTQRKQLDDAESCLRKAISMLNDTSHSLLLSMGFQGLIEVTILKENIDEASTLLKSYSNLEKKQDIKEIKSRFQLTSGYFQLQIGDLRVALEHGYECKRIAETIPNFDLIIASTKFLMEVFLRLFIFKEEEASLSICKQLLSNLEQISKQKNLYGTYSEVMLIQGLLKRATMDLKSSQVYFEQAELLAEEQGSTLISQRAQLELNRLKRQMGKLQVVKEILPEMYEQTELQEVLDYLQGVRRFLK